MFYTGSFNVKSAISHQHPGFNGEIVKERLNLLSSNDHRLYITEFDSKHYNISERALDVEDFLRMAYSHPHIDQIITWYYMETDASSQFMDDQEGIHKLNILKLCLSQGSLDLNRPDQD